MKNKFVFIQILPGCYFGQRKPLCVSYLRNLKKKIILSHSTRVVSKPTYAI